MPLKLSIVMPVLNEAALIGTALQALREGDVSDAQVIVVDASSRDDTAAIARRFADVVVQAARGRAHQMNAGAAHAKGDWLLFLHADSRLPPDALRQVTEAARRGAIWGRFDVRLSGNRFIFSVIAAAMNLRSRLTGIATGDQGIFVRRDWFERLGGYPPIALMEDIAISRRLRCQARPACLPGKVVTSSRRWEAQGVWRTIVLMWALRLQYWLGADPTSLARRYGNSSDERSDRRDN